MDFIFTLLHASWSLYSLRRISNSVRFWQQALWPTSMRQCHCGRSYVLEVKTVWAVRAGKTGGVLSDYVSWGPALQRFASVADLALNP